MPAWSGLYDGIHMTPYTAIGVAQPQRRLRRAVRGLVALKLKKTLRTFITDDVGTTITATHSRVPAPAPFSPGMNGGKITAEVVTDISRAATAADETALLLEVDNLHTPTFPTERSGNSGGGKLGF